MSDNPDPQNTPGDPTNPDSNVGGDGNDGKHEGKTAQEWAKSYKGLQGHVNKLNGQIEGMNTQVSDLTGERDTALSDIEGVRTEFQQSQQSAQTLTGEVENLTNQLTEATSNAETLQTQLDRQGLIISDYPDLAAFEAKGLLPQADSPEDLAGKLDAFRETMTTQVSAELEDTLDGSTVNQDINNKLSPDDMSEDALYAKAMSLAGDPAKEAEYEKYMNLWMERQDSED
jgi:chromosome segregation ATPase